jgi:predicted RNase H-like HicB family nuclease
MAEIRVAMELWLETARENNMAVPQPMLFAS